MGHTSMENSKKIKLGTFGALWGPLGACCTGKMGLKGRKSIKAGCARFGARGVKNYRKSKKTGFSEKAKCVCPFKKKNGSLAPAVAFLARVEVGPDFPVWPKMGKSAFWKPKIDKKSKIWHRGPQSTRKVPNLIVSEFSLKIWPMSFHLKKKSPP